MTLPAVPKKLSILDKTPDASDIRAVKQDIDSLFLHLQRIRDQFTDSITTTVLQSTFTDEQAQDAVGTILQSTFTITALYDDVTPKIQFSVNDNTSLQRVEVSLDDNLIGSRKRINFVTKSHSQFQFVEDPQHDEVDLSIAPGQSRLVAVGETFTLLDTFSLVVSRYFKVQGTFNLQGDAVLHVLSNIPA